MTAATTVPVESFEVPWDRYNQILEALYSIYNVGEETALADIMNACRGEHVSRLHGAHASHVWAECGDHRLLKYDGKGGIAPTDEETAAVLRDSIRRENGRLVYFRRFPRNLNAAE